MSTLPVPVGMVPHLNPMPVPVGMVNPWVVPVHHVGIVPNPTADAVAVAVAAVVAVANATCTGILFSLV